MQFRNDQMVDTPIGIGRVTGYDPIAEKYEVSIEYGGHYIHIDTYHYHKDEISPLYEAEMVGTRYE